MLLHHEYRRRGSMVDTHSQVLPAGYYSVPANAAAGPHLPGERVFKNALLRPERS